MSPELLIFIIFLVLFVCIAAAVRMWIKKSRDARSLARYNAVAQSGVDIPPTLHPVFDAARCIGSGACTHVCPQGDDVVGRIHSRGVLIDPTSCIGHGRCAASCPMGAIRLVFGTSERGVDIPHLSNQFETNVPGLYITGELGGMGLIANAVRQAKEGMANIARVLKNAPSATHSPDMVDVLIIGAGPAGLASALAARFHGLSYRLFEQESSVGGAILQYPRNKIVMTQAIPFPLAGTVQPTTMNKAKLVSMFERIIARHDIRLEPGMRVEQISRQDDGSFIVESGETKVHARKVMLSIGRRGTPRKLGVPGEHLPHVRYTMTEPDTYTGQRVLVVGGGNSAVETACLLAELPQTQVSLSYRGNSPDRANAANRERFEALVSENKLQAIANSTVSEITPEYALLTRKESEVRIPADAVIVQIGGELPSDLLKHYGVSLERHFGEETEKNRTMVSGDDVFHNIRRQRRAEGLQNFHVEKPGIPGWLKWLLGILTIAVLGVLFHTGRAYYLTPETIRRDMESLQVFRASGTFGHTLGIWAAALMAFNLLYFARKEFRVFSRLGSIHSWMYFHQFSGLLAAMVVLLHTALILHNAFALALYISMGLLLLTGIIGRYLYVMVPTDPRGRPLTHEALVDLSERMKEQYSDLFGQLDITIEISKVLDRGYQPNHSFAVLLLRLFTIWPYRLFQLAGIFRRARRQLAEKEMFRAFKHYGTEMARLHLQLEISWRIKRLLSLWRHGHAVLAMLTVALVIIHVIIEIQVGYLP